MQRVLKRTAQAQRQVVRRAAKQAKKGKQETRNRHQDVLTAANREIRNNLRDARRARREDWELGPLAPKRDLGFNDYGTFQENLRQDYTNNGVFVARQKVVEQRCAWAGGVKQLSLAPDDRVVILDGPDKGKIDRIKAINAESGTLTLQNRHQALFNTWIDGRFNALPMPISIASVRLVYPITNPETGVTKDTVIHQLKAVPPNMQSENMSLDRWEHGYKWDRLVPGINVVIPWPEVEVPEFVTNDIDTARDKVEDRTFFYNLLSAPMPTEIVDELRNKYSRFRTRHEPSYIAKKEAEAAQKKGSHALLQSMKTPLDEFHEKQRALKEAEGEPQLTDDMLEKLGAIIAQTKAVSLEDAGVSEVSENSPDKTTPLPPPVQ